MSASTVSMFPQFADHCGQNVWQNSNANAVPITTSAATCHL